MSTGDQFEMPVQRVNSRGSRLPARPAALAVVIVLGGIAWIGFSGKQAPQVANIAPVPAVASSMQPTSGIAVITPGASVRPRTPAVEEPRATPRPATEAVGLRDDAFAVIAVIDGRLYLDVLREEAPGFLRGSFRLPFPRQQDGHMLEFSQLWTQDRSRQNYVPLGNWPLLLDALSPDTEQAVNILDESVGPQPNRRRVPRPLRAGFAISVGAESHQRYAVVDVEVQFGSHVARSDSGYVVTGTVGETSFTTPLFQVASDRLTGQYWLPDAVAQGALSFEITRVRDGGPARQTDSLGPWTLDLVELASNHRSEREPLIANVPPRPTLTGGPAAIQRGYRLGVYVRMTFDYVVVIDFDMQLGPGRQLKGDDGLMGGRQAHD